MRKPFPLLFVLLLSIAGCEIYGNLNDGDTTEKTYPGAEDLPLVTVQALKTTVPVPGSYNVRAYVTGILVCPPELMCYIADRMEIADSPDDHNPDHVIAPAAYPYTQFEVGAYYLMSLEADTNGAHDHLTDDKPFRTFRLLGYDRLR